MARPIEAAIIKYVGIRTDGVFLTLVWKDNAYWTVEVSRDRQIIDARRLNVPVIDIDELARVCTRVHNIYKVELSQFLEMVPDFVDSATKAIFWKHFDAT